MAEKRRGWNTEEISFIKTNYGILTLHQISSKLSRSYNSVSKKIHKLKLDDPRKWTKEEDKILVENYEYNPEVFSLLPNRSYDAVKNRASKTFNLKRDTGNCPVDHKFFERLDEEVAYVLGFFIADGCVERKPQVGARITFSQRTEDKDILYKIREVMQSKSPLSFKKNRNEVSLYIHNGNLVNCLNSMGFNSNKTFTADIPNHISDTYMPSLIRGLLDGDGSIYTDGKYPVVQFLGTYKVLTKVRQYFIRQGVTSKPQVRKRTNVNVHELKYKKQDSVKIILELLYSTSIIHMERKYNKAMDALNILNGAFAREETPRKINPAQIGETLLSDVKGNPESKTDIIRLARRDYTLGPQKGYGIVRSI